MFKKERNVFRVISTNGRNLVPQGSFAERLLCHSRVSHRESSPWKIREFWIPAYAGMAGKLANGSFCKRLSKEEIPRYRSK
jgi:hypothetical protein